MDNLSQVTRSRIMASIKGKNTRPEVIVRKLIWAQGRRYRVHDRRVPGTPDISNKRCKLAVFIDGCFWHGCASCYREPRSNVLFWRHKLKANLQRRTKVKRQLKSSGWRVLEFWEHEVLSNPSGVAKTVERYMQVRTATVSRRKGYTWVDEVISR
jgi:DNA mismatch endonuclease (patch repair protein)